MTYPVDATESTTATKKPGPALWLSIVTIIVGTAVGIAGLAIAISKAVHEFNGPVYVAPRSIHKQLSAGTYNLYAGVLSDTSSTPLTGDGITTVTVTGPSGSDVPVFTATTNEFIGRGSTEYYAVDTFKVTESGNYTIAVQGSNGEPFFVASTFGDLAKRAAGWIVMMVIGILIGLAGVIMLIAGIVRRRRAKRPPFGYTGVFHPGAPGYQPGASGYQPGYQPGGPVPPPAAALPPAGWYPDPQMAGTNRYWDGARWTDQTQAP